MASPRSDKAAEATIALLVAEALARAIRDDPRGATHAVLRQIASDDRDALDQARRRCLTLTVLDRQTRARAIALLTDARQRARQHADGSTRTARARDDCAQVS